MPYADVERRRKFQREYKRKWRARQGKINPLLDFKVYVCPRFPHLRVGLGHFFDAGFLITDRPEVQAQVERLPEFGVHIFPLKVDLDLTGPLLEDDE
jgi:hypothetical protein